MYSSNISAKRIKNSPVSDIGFSGVTIPFSDNVDNVFTAISSALALISWSWFMGLPSGE